MYNRGSCAHASTYTSCIYTPAPVLAQGHPTGPLKAMAFLFRNWFGPAEPSAEPPEARPPEARLLPATRLLQSRHRPEPPAEPPPARLLPEPPAQPPPPPPVPQSWKRVKLTPA